jgi:hypothetical protein
MTEMDKSVKPFFSEYDAKTEEKLAGASELPSELPSYAVDDLSLDE